MINFKPNLYPNNAVDGSDIDWHTRLGDSNKWYVSEKFDGIRIEFIFNKLGTCVIKTRALKRFRSVWINRLEEAMQGVIQSDCVVEGEIYCNGMRFNELQHFIISGDVESVPAIKKMAREHKKGKFPDRTLPWLTNYNHPFRIHLFDFYRFENDKFERRKDLLYNAYQSMRVNTGVLRLVTQKIIGHTNGIINLYNEIIEGGGEGVLLKRYDNIYKMGRNSLLQKTVFKMKDEIVWFDGVVLDVLEGTEVDQWADKIINELGRSVTSKSIYDRSPSGMAKAFSVLTPNGIVKVTLKGWDNKGKEYLLDNKQKYYGLHIKFLGMKPTKLNGLPRQAKAINNNYEL